MKAGLALDIKVYEAIKGVKLRAFQDDPNTIAYCYDTGNGASTEVRVPLYSSDISAAWKLIEQGLVESVVKLSDGRYFSRPMPEELDDEFKPQRSKGFNHTSLGYYEIPVEDEYGTIAATAPHAICLAALKAIG